MDIVITSTWPQVSPLKGGRCINYSAGLPGPKKLKRPNLAISSFKKCQILTNEKRPNKGQIFFKNFLKQDKQI